MRNRWFLLVMATCGALGAASGAHGQERNIRDCLQGWDIPLKLPYFPQYSGGNCHRTEPKGAAGEPSRYFTGQPRSVDLSLSASSIALIAAVGREHERIDMGRTGAEAAFAHFDAWFRSQGFERTALGEGNSSAVYEKARADGRLLIGLQWPSAQSLTLRADQLAALRPGIALPAPDAAFRFHDGPQKHAALFTLPGSELREAIVRGGDQEVVHVANPLLRRRWEPDGKALMFLPETYLTYTFPRDVLPNEALAAWREALKRAGWTLTAKDEARYRVGSRELVAKLRASDNLGTTAWVRLIDPWFQQQQIEVQASLEALGQYSFAPLLPDGARADEVTALRLAAASFKMSTERPRGTTGVYLVDIAPLAAAPAFAERAQRMSAWVKAQLATLGWEEKRIEIRAETLAPGREVPGLDAGVRVSVHQCNTRAEERPGGSVSYCQCSQQNRGQSFRRPGACTP